jgi:DNA-binding CsgD family transcriptional regulator/PAS domain-containing protein
MQYNETAVFLSLVERIHAASLDPGLWPEVVARIGAAVGAKAGTIFVHDFADSSAHLDGGGPDIVAFDGFDSSSLQAYATHYSMTNVWTANEDTLPAGSAVTSSALYPDSMLKKTEFYGDWLHEQNFFYALGSVVEKEDTRAMKLSFLRPERAGQFGEADLVLARALMPHLRTAIAVHRRIHRLSQLSHSALAAIELLAQGVIFVTANGQLLHWNGAARQISRRTGSIAITGNGELSACTHSLSLKLAEAIRRACKPAVAGAKAPGTLLRLPSKTGDVQVYVAPAGIVPASPFPAGTAAALFVTESSGKPMGLADALGSVYGASPAEAALGEALVNGKSLKEFAMERDVSLNTVKTQLKGLSAKVGAKRQVDVVRAILAGPVMFRRA